MAATAARPLEETLRTLPAQPGAYLMKDAAGAVIYVGKAANLRSRVRSYFQEASGLDARKRGMVERVAHVETIVAASETEALVLEYNLIKRYRPRYNLRLRDDKKYPYIKITVQEAFSRLVVVRDMEHDGARYFGPYANTRSMWDTIRLLRRIFGMRQALVASAKKRAGCNWQPGKSRPRACLDYYIGQCLAPCVGAVSQEQYRAAVDQAILFLEGRYEVMLDEMRRRMAAHAQALQFEAASRLRDQVAAVERAMAEQRIILTSPVDADAIAHAMREDVASVAVFEVRRGRLMAETYRILEGVSGLPEAEVLGEFLKRHYARAASIPKQVLLPHPVEEQAVLERWLCERRGGKVLIMAPRRGDRRELVELAAANAAQRLKEALEQVGAEEKRGQEAVTELRQALGLADRPDRIEAFDISTLRGRESVGSMVVFEGGQPKKADYRRFRIRLTTADSDDVAMMGEVLQRRLRAAAASSKFAKLPDLLLVDGGKPQLNAALQAMEQIGVTLPAAGLAKEHEFVYLPNRPDPVILPANSKALHLLQRVRDEAHRFAQAYHHALRERRTRESALDEVPGIGAARKRRLLAHFGSLAKLRAASAREIARVPGVPPQVAEAVADRLRSGDGGQTTASEI